MGARGAWTPGKIILLVVGILAALGLLCCGGLWVVYGDKARAGWALVRDSSTFVERLQKEFGARSAFGVEPDDKDQVILTIGAEGDLTPERIREVQDKAWKIYAEVFAADGGMPVHALAVGHPTGRKGRKTRGFQAGQIVEWTANIVTVEELVKRTGVAAPPVSPLIADELKIESGGDSEDDDEVVPETPKEEKGDDAGGK
jgi:hypothetical protein